jgi:hypothetical protein
MALAVEHLSSEWETLSSNPSTEKKKKKEEGEVEIGSEKH